MSLRDWSRTPSMRIALGALGVALVANVWVLVRALRLPPMSAPPVTTLASLETMVRDPKRTPTNIAATVENDLFASDRSAPSAPYRMPGETAVDDKPAVEPMRPIVLGTAVATDGHNFATVQLGDGRPTLVRVGGKIGEWVVKAIERGKIVLVSSGGSRVDITVPKPGT
jgi:hypothetical protein